MFNIAFVPDMRNENGYELGQMMLGASTEGFRSSLSYWIMTQYEEHWRDAVTRLVNGDECSALITDLPPPSPTGYAITWWPMWRKDDTIYIQEHLLIQSELREVFDPSDPYMHISPRSTEVDSDEPDNGFRTSEWSVPLQDFVDFLQNAP